MKSYKGLISRYIKNEKKSVIPIFISIILTIAVITSVAFITQNTMKNSFEEKKLAFGDYDIRLQKIDNDKLEKLKENDNVLEYALGKEDVEVFHDVWGDVSGEELFVNKHIPVYALEKKVIDEYVNLNVIKGRLPQSENEVVASADVLNDIRVSDLGTNVELMTSTDEKKSLYSSRYSFSRFR